MAGTCTLAFKPRKSCTMCYFPLLIFRQKIGELYGDVERWITLAERISAVHARIASFIAGDNGNCRRCTGTSSLTSIVASSVLYCRGSIAGSSVRKTELCFSRIGKTTWSFHASRESTVCCGATPSWMRKQNSLGARADMDLARRSMSGLAAKNHGIPRRTSRPSGTSTTKAKIHMMANWRY